MKEFERKSEVNGMRHAIMKIFEIRKLRFCSKPKTIKVNKTTIIYFTHINHNKKKENIKKGISLTKENKECLSLLNIPLLALSHSDSLYILSWHSMGIIVLLTTVTTD